MRIDLIYLLITALSSSVKSHKYYFIADNMNWKDAQAFCRQHYIDLATVDDQTDLNELIKTVPMRFKQSLWIGLYRMDDSAPWIWSDRSKSTFRLWQPSQPNNSGDVQYCVLTSPTGSWNDWDCSDDLAFICYTEKIRQTVRLEVKSSQNVSDPLMKEDILTKVEQILKAKGLPTEATLSWKTFSGEHVFHKMWYQKSDVSNAVCKRNLK